MSPTGSRWNFGSRAVPGSTCGNPASQDHHLELDMEHATLIRRFTWQDAAGTANQVVQRRFVSREDEHLAGLKTEFTAENWSDSIQVRSGLDGRILNAGVKRYRDLNSQHLTTLGQTEVDRGNRRASG